MKKIFSEKVVALSFVLIALIVSYYLYQRGEISLFPQKEKKTVPQDLSTQILINDREYRISYKNRTDSAFDITNFENDENWYGDGEFDYSTFLEGESSLFLTSLNNRKVSVSLNKSFDLKKVLNFKFLVYLGSESVDIEELNLIFIGQNFNYRFPIRDLTKDWNLLTLPKAKFTYSGSQTSGDKTFLIEKVTVELISRPQARTIINLDNLWAEKEEDYLKDWISDSDNFLSLRRIGDSFGLLAIGRFGNRAVLNKGSAKDYTFQAKFTPVKAGNFGFFLRGDYQSGYGYYLTMDGVGTSSWQVYKYGFSEDKNKTSNLNKGEISNFKLEKDRPYWLKAEMKGPRLIFHFSVDGQSFETLGEVKDTSFSSGGVGFAVSSESLVLIDEIIFFQ